MTITNQELLEIHEALKKLDGTEGQSKQTLDDRVVYRLGRNLKRVQGLVRELEEDRQKLIEELADEGATELTGDQAREFNKRWRVMLKEEVDIELRQIDRSLLDAGKNRIPFAVIAALLDTVIHDDGDDETQECKGTPQAVAA